MKGSQAKDFIRDSYLKFQELKLPFRFVKNPIFAGMLQTFLYLEDPSGSTRTRFESLEDSVEPDSGKLMIFIPYFKDEADLKIYSELAHDDENSTKLKR